MWFIQLRLGGESIPITASSAKACIAEAEYIKAEYRAGKRTKLNGGNLTLREAIDQYISVRDNVLSPATVRGYNVIRDNRFKNEMDKRICDITDWQKVVNDEAQRVSAKTLKNSWLFVASVLREATKLEPPKVRLPSIVKKDPKFLEPEQILVFINAITGEAWETEALLALHGLRRSEIWAKPEISKDIIAVRGAVVQGPESKLVKKKENKNDPSRRDVPILIPRLRVITSASGNDSTLAAFAPDTLRKRINRTCTELGFQEVGTHGLRHSFASLCYYLNIPERVAMQFGGWKDRETMHEVYIHLAKRAVARSESALTDFFKNTGSEEQYATDSIPFRVATYMAKMATLNLKGEQHEATLQRWATGIDKLLLADGISSEPTAKKPATTAQIH